MVEKTPVDAVYHADSFCCRFLGFQGGQGGRKALVQSAHGACKRRIVGGQDWCNLGLFRTSSRALLGSKMGT